MSTAPRPTWIEVYGNRRMAALLGLGFASGLPLLLTSRTLQAWLSDVGVEVTAIGLLSLVTLPYSFKFVAAPLMDRYVPPLLGRRRGWLLVMQVLLAGTLAAMALVGPTQASPDAALTLLAAFAVAVALCSAGHDIVGDAYRTDVLARHELGAGAAVWVMAYRVAMVLAGGVAIAASDLIGWRGVYLALAAMMGIGILATLLAPEPTGNVQPPRTLAAAVVDPLRRFVQQHGRATLLLLALIVLFKLPDQLAGQMTRPLLLQELDFDNRTVGLAETLAIGLTILGALLGGGIVARLGIVRSLWVFGILQAVSNAGFWLLSAAGGGTALMLGVMAVESLCGGLVAAGFIAFLMSLCDRRYSAFQYALLTSVMAFGGAIAGALTGYGVKAWGYEHFFAATILAGLPGLALLLVLREPTESRTEAAPLSEVLAE